MAIGDIDRFYPSIRLRVQDIPDDRPFIVRVGYIDYSAPLETRFKIESIRWVDSVNAFRADGSLHPEPNAP